MRLRAQYAALPHWPNQSLQDIEFKAQGQVLQNQVRLLRRTEHPTSNANQPDSASLPGNRGVISLLFLSCMCVCVCVCVRVCARTRACTYTPDSHPHPYTPTHPHPHTARASLFTLLLSYTGLLSSSCTGVCVRASTRVRACLRAHMCACVQCVRTQTCLLPR